MSTSFLISDLHFGHENILTFRRGDGLPMRKFNSGEEMDEHIISSWNSVVRPHDRVYLLGDVAMKQQAVDRCVPRLNGHKRLVMGNHDIFSHELYLRHFEKVFGVKVLDDLVLTHIPLHPRSVKSHWTNVHGHLHNNESDTPFTPSLGGKYFNVSCEVLGYVPVSLEEVRAEIRKESWACG